MSRIRISVHVTPAVLMTVLALAVSGTADSASTSTTSAVKISTTISSDTGWGSPSARMKLGS